MSKLDDALRDIVAEIGKPEPLAPPDDSDDEIAIAMQVARVIYGGIERATPQWQNCIEVARCLAGEPSFHIPPQSAATARAAFERCAKFNAENPEGTKGTLTSSGHRAITCVRQHAMVFMHPNRSETVMAWFENVGWHNVANFTKEAKTETLGDEMFGLAMQAKNAFKPDMLHYLLRATLLADPVHFHALNELGVYHAGRQEFTIALDYYNQAALINPDMGEVLNNRGMALRAIGHSDEALTDLKRAHKMLPAQDAIALNTASCLDDIGETAEAVKIMDAFIDRNPNNIDIRYNRALVILSDGQLREGWQEFDARLRQPMINAHYDHFPWPRWQGEKLTGKRVLIWPEQGLGDEILTASMFNDIIARAAHVTILASPRLVPLFQRSFPTATIGHRPAGPAVETFPKELLPLESLPACAKSAPFDFQLSQGDLGLHLRPDFAAFGNADHDFLKADLPNRTRLQKLCWDKAIGNLIVGISWHSLKNLRIGTVKSLALAELEPILRLPKVTFVNLQYGNCRDEIAAAEAAFGIKIHQIPGIDPLTDIDRFASLVAAMDLVITASNTTAHVAGGLGVPAWVLTPSGPGRLWYWFRGRDDSPWYRSVRLYRQPAATVWAPAVQQIADELRSMIRC